MEFLEAARSYSIRRVEKELQHRIDRDLKIMLNELTGRWEVWHFSPRSVPYFVVACEYNGHNLVPGTGVSADVLARWIQMRDHEALGHDRAWWRNRVNEEKAKDPSKKYYDDLDSLSREFRRFENGDHAVQVPKTYWRDNALSET